MSVLFTPLKVGALELPNRLIMAPLTRMRAGAGRVPTPLMARYYAQRASAGLIITEATSVTPIGVGYPDTPGIWSDEQVAGWQEVTKAVHAAGGRIVLQLWHVGRISDPSLLDGAKPVAPSAIQPAGQVSVLRPKRDFVEPRALDAEEIPGIIEAFRKGAENAKRAGFDGVELHAANGYLIDQFLQDKVNVRTDSYGGPIENRARLLLEATDALISVWGADRVGIHLAPRGDAHDMGDSNATATFTYVAKALDQRHVAFIFTREHIAGDSINPALRQAFSGVFIANENLTPEQASELIDTKQADAVGFGVKFIANPDLPTRLATGAVLNDPDPSTFHGYGQEDLAKGYTDYPFLPR